MCRDTSEESNKQQKNFHGLEYATKVGRSQRSLAELESAPGWRRISILTKALEKTCRQLNKQDIILLILN